MFFLFVTTFRYEQRILSYGTTSTLLVLFYDIFFGTRKAYHQVKTYGIGPESDVINYIKKDIVPQMPLINAYTPYLTAF